LRLISVCEPADIASVPEFRPGAAMSLIEWNDSLSVGVPSIDAQHSVLVKTLNELHDAMMSGQAQGKTGDLLRTLVRYTREHFASEEALMEQAGYAELKAHSKRHDELTTQVEDYVARFERGESTINLHLLSFLRDWLINHILKEDKAYEAALTSHGIC
jgi:hemerythrin-like metal-binding protein